MWWWILVWAVLVVTAVLYVGWRLWRLWGRAKALGRELARAQERLDAVEGQLELLGEQVATADDLAVFANPLRVAAATGETRQAGREARRRRRAASAPAWAKHVD